MNLASNKSKELVKAIPHTRGDEPAVFSSLLSARNYSPHAWG